MTPLPGAERALDRALARRALSAVSAEVGNAAGAFWTFAAGRLAFVPGAAAVSDTTIFDLASLTKVLATTTLCLDLAASGTLALDEPLAALLPRWRTPDRSMVTIGDLLEHAAGLPAHRDYFLRLTGREAYAAAIAREPLEYVPRTRSIYSDLGFMMLGFAIEDRSEAPLDVLFADWRRRVGLDAPLTYRPPQEWVGRIAATEHDPWRGRLLQGEVHDENAAALGGVAAHAGLFGTASAVGEIARWWLRRLRGEDDAVTGIPAALARGFAVRSDVPGSSRARGWDTMLPTSSCGTRMSPAAIGHTGFTGTSLWIDPPGNRYFVLLTNRVHPTRANEAIGATRREFHDAAIADLDQP